MIYFLLSRSVTWPWNLFGSNNSIQQISPSTDQSVNDADSDPSSRLISNKALSKNVEQSNNTDENISLINKDKLTQLPSASALSVLGKHYLTRDDLEKLVQARFQQETPGDRIERLLWKE
jgi:hypothetical protein